MNNSIIISNLSFGEVRNTTIASENTFEELINLTSKDNTLVSLYEGLIPVSTAIITDPDEIIIAIHPASKGESFVYWGLVVTNKNVYKALNVDNRVESIVLQLLGAIDPIIVNIPLVIIDNYPLTRETLILWNSKIYRIDETYTNMVTTAIEAKLSTSLTTTITITSAKVISNGDRSILFGGVNGQERLFYILFKDPATGDILAFGGTLDVQTKITQVCRASSGYIIKTDEEILLLRKQASVVAPYTIEDTYGKASSYSKFIQLQPVLDSALTFDGNDFKLMSQTLIRDTATQPPLEDILFSYQENEIKISSNFAHLEGHYTPYNIKTGDFSAQVRTISLPDGNCHARVSDNFQISGGLKRIYPRLALANGKDLWVEQNNNFIETTSPLITEYTIKTAQLSMKEAETSQFMAISEMFLYIVGNDLGNMTVEVTDYKGNIISGIATPKLIKNPSAFQGNKFSPYGKRLEIPVSKITCRQVSIKITIEASFLKIFQIILHSS